MPSEAQIEAAAKALSNMRGSMYTEDFGDAFRHIAITALTAAERVRDERNTPLRDWLMGKGGIGPVAAAKQRKAEEARTQPCERKPGSKHCRKCGGHGHDPGGDETCQCGMREWTTQPETGQPIPDEAVEAGAKAIWATESQVEWEALYAKDHRKNEARDKAEAVIRAAAPMIRAQALAEAKARVEAARLTYAGRPMTIPGVTVHNAGIDAALRAIDGSEK